MVKYKGQKLRIKAFKTLVLAKKFFNKQKREGYMPYLKKEGNKYVIYANEDSMFDGFGGRYRL